MLTERQLLILQTIVDDYIRSAEPVGSRTISKRKNLPYSAATIRNDMAELEEQGYLEKPHSSSGRVPSQKGYRYYVDHLLSPHHLTEAEVSDIRSIFDKKLREFEEIMEHSARILSNMTSYVSLVLGPEVYETALKSTQIVPLTKSTAILILVTDTGHVEKQLIEIPGSIDVSDIERTVNILNDRLIGIPLNELQEKLKTEVKSVLQAHVKNYERILQALLPSFKIEKSEKVYYSGKTNLLMFPEFQNVERLRNLLDRLEEAETINKLRSNEQGIRVRIGHENNMPAFEECTLITATFSTGNKYMGTIGIIGPTRMEYPRVIGLIESLSKDLSKLLTELYA